MTNRKNELPSDARVWIYQSNRPFSEHEKNEVEKEGKAFVSQWQAHGKDLTADFKVLYNRFIIIGVDEGMGAASGCSIDSSVGFIKGLEQKYNIDLLDKMNIAFKNDSNQIETLHLSEFRALLDSGDLNGDTIVYNNLINSWGDLKTKWEVPVEESWHKQLLK